jgi:hypothetical protein
VGLLVSATRKQRLLVSAGMGIDGVCVCPFRAADSGVPESAMSDTNWLIWNFWCCCG